MDTGLSGLPNRLTVPPPQSSTTKACPGRAQTQRGGPSAWSQGVRLTRSSLPHSVPSPRGLLAQEAHPGQVLSRQPKIWPGTLIWACRAVLGGQAPSRWTPRAPDRAVHPAWAARGCWAGAGRPLRPQCASSGGPQSGRCAPGNPRALLSPARTGGVPGRHRLCDWG